MKVVIDIDEEEYKAILDCAKKSPEYLNCCELMIADGKPLPKGHGRLIDADKLKTHFIGTELGTDLEVYLEPTIINAPTIIEADKAESEDA